MSRLDSDFGGPVKRRSGWLIPLAVLAITLALSALVLAYYFAPTAPELVEEQPAPTTATDRVTLQVGTLKFRIPANYIQYASARRGGPRAQVALIALLPGLGGYSFFNADALASNAPDSQAIYPVIREEPFSLGEADRLERIYLVQTQTHEGKPGPYGLTQFAFRADSGYRDEDLFVGETPAGIVVLRCSRLSEITPSPNCLRDMKLAEGVALSYRFKRAHLDEWRDIDVKMRALIDSFIRRPQRAP